jgi:predicted RNA-binding protein with PUA-like domain
LAPLKEPVSLETIKTNAILKEMKLVKNSRLSVAPVTAPEFTEILRLAKTKMPK